MNGTKKRLSWSVLILWAVAAWFYAADAYAVEETQRFLDALRSAGYHDIALEYLEQMRTSPLADKEFQQTIDYEAGTTLIQAAQKGRSIAAREKQLSQADELLKRFLQQHAEHPRAAGARTQLANVLMVRGRIKVEQTESATKTDAEKQVLFAQARELFGQAEATYKELYEALKAAHAKFPKLIDRNDTEQLKAREQVRRELLGARLELARVPYEIAQTYPAGSKERKANLTEAAKRFADYYADYASFAAGLYARMWEGRCYKELGQTDKAFEAFEELLAQPDDPPAYRLAKNKTLVLYLETCLLPEVKKYQEAAKKYLAWEENARGDEEVSPEGLAIKCLAAEAMLERARTLKPNDPEQGSERRELLGLSRELLNFVSRAPGEYQQRARMLAVSPELSGGEQGQLAEPTNFEEARDRGRLALDRMSAAETEKQLDLEQGKRDRLAEYEQQIEAARREAIKYFRLALQMRTAATSVDDVNVLRYYLAHLNYSAGDYYSAAVLSEFLMRRYPNSAGGKPSAKIALACYAKLYNEAPAEDRSFEIAGLRRVADFMAQRWPQEPEADEARMTLIQVCILNGNLDTALEVLQTIPTDSPRRGTAELMTGQALWGEYLKAARLPEGERPSQERLDDMVAKAQSTLQAGLERMRTAVEAGAEVNYTLAASALSLAQMHIEAGEPEKALPWLDDEKIGVMTLVKAKHQATDRGNFRIQAYKAALRAYVAAQRLDDAEAAMKSLEELVEEGGDEEASKRLTQILISLGYQLQQQLERLRNEQKTEQVKKVSQGFELFLTKISERQEGNTFNSLNWVAATFAGLAAGFDTGGEKLPAEAENYYRKAAATYQRMLKRIQEEPDFAPEGAADGVKVRLARCLRRLGEYRSAFALLYSVLKQRPTMVEAQVEAAHTYGDWGREKPGYYVLAITGSQKYREVWGWGQLARRVGRVPDYRDVFHEARYNLALCRFKLALTKSDKAQKDAVLEQAERDIAVVYRLYPEMGGPEWTRKYDTLLKKIQGLLGKSQQGLKALESTTASR